MFEGNVMEGEKKECASWNGIKANSGDQVVA